MKYHNWQHTTDMPPLLSEFGCHIWLWDFSAKEMNQTVLSAGETDVARRFIFEEDRAKYVLCHCMLRYLLSAYLQSAPEGIEIAQSKFGKPMLIGRFSGLHFSLSHTSSHAILAISHFPVGADVELVRPIENAVAEMHFSNDEQRQLAIYTGKDWLRGFFRCWTRKEALLKAEGVGLNVDLGSFDVEIAHNKAAVLLRHRAGASFTKKWRLHDVSFSSQVIAAVAVDPAVQELALFAIDSKAAGIP